MDIPKAEDAFSQAEESQYKTNIQHLLDTIAAGEQSSVLYWSPPGSSAEAAKRAFDRMTEELTPLGYRVAVEDMRGGAIRLIRVSWHPDDVKEVRDAEEVH